MGTGSGAAGGGEDAPSGEGQVPDAAREFAARSRRHGGPPEQVWDELADAYGAEFGRRQERGLAEAAVVARLRALDLTPHDHPDRGRRLEDLARDALEAYERFAEPKHGHLALAAVRSALTVADSGRESLHELAGHVLLARFEFAHGPGDGEPAERRPEGLLAGSRTADLIAYLRTSGPEEPGPAGARDVRDARDLAEALRHYRRAADLAGAGPAQARYLGGLGNALLFAYEHGGEEDTLEEAVRSLAGAAERTPADAPARHAVTGNYANALCTRFGRYGDPADLDRAYGAIAEAYRLTGPDHPAGPLWATVLGNVLVMRFGERGRPEDLREGVKVLAEAVERTPDDHPDLAMRLRHLGVAYAEAFWLDGEPNLLDQAVDTLRRAVGAAAPGHPEAATLDGSLGNSLLLRFQRRGRAQDLDEAVAHLRRATVLGPPGDPHRDLWTGNLASALEQRFGLTGDPADLDEAVDGHRRAVEAAADGHRDTAVRRAHLGLVMVLRFEVHGAFTDLDAGVRLMSEALGDLPPSGLVRGQYHANLATALHTRFVHLGQGPDLEAALRHTEAALTLLPAGSADRVGCLNNQATLLTTRYAHTGDTVELTRAAAVLDEALGSLADGETARAALARNRAQALLQAHLAGARETSGDTALLDRAWADLETALAVEGRTAPDRAMTLELQGTVLLQRYAVRADPDDLRRAEEVLERALARLGDTLGDTRRTLVRHRLAVAQRARGKHALSRATGLSMLADRSWDVLLQSGTDDGLRAARRAARTAGQVLHWCLEDHAARDAVAAAESARALVLSAGTASATVPQLLDEAGEPGLAEAWRQASRRNTARRFVRLPPHGAGSQADGLALAGAGAGPGGDAGAGASGLPGSRGDGTATPGVVPITPGVVPIVPGAASPGDLPGVPDDLRHRALEVLYRRGGGEVRAPLVRVPSRTLIGKALAQLGADGLVYLVAGEQDGSGWALLVRPDGSGRVLPLRQLVRSGPLAAFLAAHDAHVAAATDGDRSRSRAAWRSALHAVCDWAWPAVVNPVLEEFGLRRDGNRAPCAGRTGAPAEGSCPRLYLVPTGPLGLVPWHAARRPDTGRPGQYRYAVQDAAFSYAASGRELIQAADRPCAGADAAAVVVRDPTGDLEHARREAEGVRAGWPGPATLLGGKGTPDAYPATPNRVLSALPGRNSVPCALLHLACHGALVQPPTASHLLLAGGQRLTVRRLLTPLPRRPEQGGQEPGPLAVLSACATGVPSGDHDEALSLATAFLAAGASAVVGSLWLVDDRRTADLMLDFHRRLRERDLAAADALREAQLAALRTPRDASPTTAEGRGSGKEGDGNDDTDPADPYVWAAFIHHGRGELMAPDRATEPHEDEPAQSPDDDTAPTTGSAPGERIFPIRRAPAETEHWQCPDPLCTHRAPGDDEGPFEDECCPVHPALALERRP
ncbi:CHAT domain-containing protein [Streptomyces sp. NPDC017936]|uniref:CHAT domain-containing protein n=1 Tax=Streptomyces sp. NPDC017936 TaxID=3365016 RepID=UPI00378D79D5